MSAWSIKEIFVASLQTPEATSVQSAVQSAASFNDAALWTVGTCLLSTVFNTALLIVPPTPSTAPLPCDVAKQCHFTLNPVLFLTPERKCTIYLFLNWELGPSEKTSTASTDGLALFTNSLSALFMKVATTFLSWFRSSLMIAWLETDVSDKPSAFVQMTTGKTVSCLWFQWTD